jgi:F420-0:gamma-glutamyl ligase-like protein
MNWIWIVVATPAAVAGFVLGRLLSRQWVDQPETVRRAGRVCVASAIALWVMAFVNAVPLACNAAAIGALMARAGLYYPHKRAMSGGVQP